MKEQYAGNLHDNSSTDSFERKIDDSDSDNPRRKRSKQANNNQRDLCAGDMFSLGASLYELAVGKPLEKSGPQWKRLRTHPDEACQHVLDKTGSRFFANILRKCLEPNPSKRARAEDIRRLCDARKDSDIVEERDMLKKQLADARLRLSRFEKVVSTLLAKGEEGRENYRNRHSTQSK